MSFIEVMGAIALFALFGSSIFVAQQYIFERLALSNVKVHAFLLAQKELMYYKKAIMQEYFENKGKVVKSLAERMVNLSAPVMTAVVRVKSLYEQEKKLDQPAKKRLDNLHDLQDLYMITAQVFDPDKKTQLYYASYQFMHIPQVVS
jgi:hypothetical protein